MKFSTLCLVTLSVLSVVGVVKAVSAPPPVFPLDPNQQCSDQGSYVDADSEALCEAGFTWASANNVDPNLKYDTGAIKTSRKGCIFYDNTSTIFWNSDPDGYSGDVYNKRICIDPSVISATNSGGDPHFIGFNQKVVTYQGECTLVLLDSLAAAATGDNVTIHVRTTRKLDFSYISGVAMKIGEDIIEVKPNADILLNGSVITGEGVTMSGLPFVLTKEVKGTKKMIVSYSFDIGHGRVIDVQANKKRGMMFVRTKGLFPEETVGMLGSPVKSEMVSRDGKVLMKDVDEIAYGESWQVKDTDVQLFQEALGPQYPQKCLYEDAPGATAQLRGRRKLMAKKVVTVEEARAACAGVSGEVKRELCVQDSISMGELDLKDDPFYME